MAEQIVAEYKLDVNQAVSGLDKLQKEYADTENAAKKAAQTSNDSFLKGSDGAKRLEAELKKQPKTLAEIELKLKNLRELLRDDTKIGTEGFKKISAEIKKTEGQLNSLNEKTKATGNAFEGVGSIVKKVGGLILAAFAVDRIIAFGKEAIKLAAQSEGVERAFERIGSPQILKGLQEATRGTVSDLVLMQNAVKASNFKIPLENLASLFKFAQARARETGESVDYLVDSIILGIGRKSPLILDNLGISTVALREKLKGVGTETASVGDIAQAVGSIATEELAKMGDQADTTSDKMERLAASWDNFSVSVGHSLIAIGDFTLFMTEAASITSLGGKQLEDYSKRALTAALALTELQLATGENVGIFTRYKVLLFGLSDAQEEFIKKSRESNEIRDEEYITVERLNRLYEAVDKGRQTEIRNVFFLQNAIKGLKDERAEEGTTRERILAINKMLIPLEEELAVLLGKESKAVKELVEALKSMPIKEAETRFGEFFLTSRDGVVVLDFMRNSLDGLNELLKEQSTILNSSPEFSQRYKDAQKAIEDLKEELKTFNDDFIDPSQGFPDAAPGGSESATGLGLINIDEQEDNYDKALQNFIAYATAVQDITNGITNAIIAAHDNELASLESQLESGQISREEYDKKRRQLERKKAIDQKNAAIFDAVIATALAVANALSVAPPLGYILAGISAALGAVQIGVIASQPLPSFKDGGLVREHGLLKGKSHAQGGIQVEAEGNEYFMPTEPTLKNYGLLEAMRKGIEDQYIMKHYVPRMIDESIFKGMNDIGKSADLNGLTASLKDHNIIAGLDRLRQSQTYGFKYLAKELKSGRNQKRGGYNA